MVGKVGERAYAHRARELVAGEPGLEAAVHALLAVRDITDRQIAALETRILAFAKSSDPCRRLMTVPGVGALTAVAFVATIDQPQRFARSSGVGAYLGLTPRRYQSGEVDHAGRISKCGDGLTRTYLFEAAGTLLTRVSKWSTLTKGVGHPAGQTGRDQQGTRRRRAQAGGDHAPGLARRHIVPLVGPSGSDGGRLMR